MAFLLKLPLMKGIRQYKKKFGANSLPELITHLKSLDKNKFLTLYMTIDLLKQHVEVCHNPNCTCSTFKDYICKMLLDIIEFKNDTCNNSRCKICSCDSRQSTKKRKRPAPRDSNSTINYIFLLRYIEKINEMDQEFLKRKTNDINIFLKHKCSKNCDYPHCRGFKKFYRKMADHIMKLSQLYKEIPLDYNILNYNLVTSSLKSRKF
tara:strand:- start:521 stop:1141 length:621 start_codon:yes stop_codon:yes gene_type:complete